MPNVTKKMATKASFIDSIGRSSLSLSEVSAKAIPTRNAPFADFLGITPAIGAFLVGIAFA